MSIFLGLQNLMCLSYFSEEGLFRHMEKHLLHAEINSVWVVIQCKRPSKDSVPEHLPWCDHGYDLLRAAFFTLSCRFGDERIWIKSFNHWWDFAGRGHWWNFCLWRTEFCLCGEMSAWFIGGNIHTPENTELSCRTEQRHGGLNYADFTLPPAFILVLNQCIK